MISRTLKAMYYATMAMPMRINGQIYKTFRSPKNGTVKVQLGPGQKGYIPGWVNLDANKFSARIDVWANLLDGLPFRDNSVDVIYSHHVIEHLPDSFLPNHLQEMHRCLKPGGSIRIGGPNGDSAAKKLIERDASWFSDFPEHRKSVGGRFANFILCKGEHLTILTLSYLEELLIAAGFSDVRPCIPRTETHHPQLIGPEVLAGEWENTPECPHTLMVEAEKRI
jgi:predicted SAM-dependent methyltransferase